MEVIGGKEKGRKRVVEKLWTGTSQGRGGKGKGTNKDQRQMVLI